MDTEKWIEEGRRELKGVCDNPLFESQVLLGSVLNLSLPELYFKENSVLGLKSQREFLKRIRLRKEGCPTAYITGEKEFFKRRFFTGPGVFIPRPETEGLVEIALSFIYPSGRISGETERTSFPLFSSVARDGGIGWGLKEKSFRGVDFGAGGGCVALTLALENPSARFVAVESAASALPYLEKNRTAWKMEQRVRISSKDVRRLELKDITAFLGGKPNIITANPPYIDTDDAFLEDSVRRFEPPSALFSGKEGMAHIYSWFSKAVELICSGGVYIFETGGFQGRRVRNFLNEKTELKSYKIHKDLQGRDRVAVCVKK